LSSELVLYVTSNIGNYKTKDEMYNNPEDILASRTYMHTYPHT